MNRTAKLRPLFLLLANVAVLVFSSGCLGIEGNYNDSISFSKNNQYQRQRRVVLEEMELERVKTQGVVGGAVVGAAFGGAIAQIIGDDLPYGRRLPNDMVISPFAPKKRPIPIKFFPPPKNRMECPYTHKFFLIPEESRERSDSHDTEQNIPPRRVDGIDGAREKKRQSNEFLPLNNEGR